MAYLIGMSMLDVRERSGGGVKRADSEIGSQPSARQKDSVVDRRTFDLIDVDRKLYNEKYSFILALNTFG